MEGSTVVQTRRHEDISLNSDEHSQPPEILKERLERYDVGECISHVLAARQSEEVARIRAATTANHRRAPSVPPPIPLQRPQLQDTAKECSEQRIFRRGRDKDRECDTRECTRGKSLSPSWGSGQSKPKYEALEMSGSRPGKGAHSKHNLAGKVFEDLTRDRSSSPTEIPDPQESADLYENEGELVDVEVVKKPKPNTAPRRKQHSSEPDPIYVQGEEQLNAFAGGDVREKKAPHENSGTHVTPEWGPYVRYKTRLGGSFKDYGGPEDTKAAVPTMPSSFLKSSIGGHRPVNTLGNGPDSSVISPKRQPKAFDITSKAAQRHEPEYPATKRQKVDGPVRNSGPSGGNIVDLVQSEATSSQISGGQKRKNSGHGYSQNESRSGSGQHLTGRVEEYRTVEDRLYVKSTRRARQQNPQQNGNTSDIQSIGSKTSSNSSSRTQTKPGTISRPGQSQYALEDPADPISDNERFGGRPETQKSSLEVVIQSYQGTSHLHVARPKANGIIKRKIRETEESSEYFGNDQGALQRKYSLSSQSSLGSFASRNPQKNIQNGNGSKEPAHKYEDKDKGTLDDLTVADDLLGQNSDASKARATQAFGSTSKDAKNTASKRSLDLGRTGPSKRNKRNIILGERERLYGVLQIFSETHHWLLNDSNTTWHLREDHKTGRLTFFDSESTAIPNLEFTRMSINKIHRNPNSAKLFINRNRDGFAPPKICLELQSRDLSAELCDSLTKADPSIDVVSQDSDYLDKVFLKTLKDSETARKRARPRSEAEPDDIQLLTSQQKARHIETETRRQDRRLKRSQRQPADYEEDELTWEPRKPLHAAMRTRSSDPIEAPEQQTKPPTIPSQGFYGSSRSTPPQSMVESSYGTRSITRASTRESKSKLLPKERTPSPERWTQRHPNWREDWTSSVIYPREGKKKAVVDSQDIKRLDEGEFLNDNLIVFYLLWMEHRLEQEQPELAKRIYFHNTFFYTSLTKGVKGKNRINYEAVRRWTSKVDLLSYDYIIVPVNEQAHWYVVIICNAPKLLPTDSPVEEVLPAEKNDIEPPVDKVDRLPSSPAQGTPRLGTNLPAKEIDVTYSLESGSEELCKNKGNDHDDAAGRAQDLHAETPKFERNDPTPNDPDIEMADAPLAKSAPEGQRNSPELKSPPVKRSKRKSTGPPPRKLDPTEPRIIVLDSLGVHRTVASTNLREYMIEEIKDKRNIVIPSPGSLGMSAKILPQQDNYYDCGVFLLEYIEKFLERPDDFIRGLVRKEFDYPIQWRQQTGMRTHIRDILFDLQKEQAAAEKLKKEKKQKKKPTSKSQPLAMETTETLLKEQSPRAPRISKKVTVDGRDIHPQKGMTVPVVEILKGPKDTSHTTIVTHEDVTEMGNSHDEPLAHEPITFLGNIYRRSKEFFRGQDRSQAEPSQLGRTESTPVEVSESPQSRHIRLDKPSAPSDPDSVIYAERQYAGSPSQRSSTKVPSRSKKALHHSSFDASIDLSIEDDEERAHGEQLRQSHSHSRSRSNNPVSTWDPGMTHANTQKKSMAPEEKFSIPPSPQLPRPSRGRQGTPFPEPQSSRNASPDSSTHSPWEGLPPSARKKTVDESQMDDSVEFVDQRPRPTEIPSSYKDENEGQSVGDSDDEMLLDGIVGSKRDYLDHPVRRLSMSSSDTQKDASSPTPGSPQRENQEFQLCLSRTSPGRRQHVAVTDTSLDLETSRKIPPLAPSTAHRDSQDPERESRSVSTFSSQRRQSVVKPLSPIRSRKSDASFRDPSDSAIIGRYKK